MSARAKPRSATFARRLAPGRRLKHHEPTPVTPFVGPLTRAEAAALEELSALGLILPSDDKPTLEDIGAVLSLSRERIRQIEEQALKKLAVRIRRDVVPDVGHGERHTLVGE